MKSGLGDRNNSCHHSSPGSVPNTSQWSPVLETGTMDDLQYRIDCTEGLNEVRSWRPEQSVNMVKDTVAVLATSQ